MLHAEPRRRTPEHGARPEQSRGNMRSPSTLAEARPRARAQANVVDSAHDANALASIETLRASVPEGSVATTSEVPQDEIISPREALTESPDALRREAAAKAKPKRRRRQNQLSVTLDQAGRSRGGATQLQDAPHSAHRATARQPNRLPNRAPRRRQKSSKSRSRSAVETTTPTQTGEAGCGES
jgi:hypothetical protein